MAETQHSVPGSEELAALLRELGRKVRQHLIGSRNIETDARTVGREGGDTIYAIDRRAESVISSALEDWPVALRPFLVVAEGFGRDGRRRFGDTDRPLLFRVLIDPIDGTRSLMYDKRSAWFLAAIAPDDGEATSLSNSVASAMIEIPTSKQMFADSFIFAKGHPVAAFRERIDGSEFSQLAFRPSQEASLVHGFGQVANFFPGTKRLASDLMERIAEATLGRVEIGQATIFDDQYISTGGQFVELVVGHDRFCCDLRPLFYDIMERRSTAPIARGLECHPYDLAGLPVARHAGVILTDGLGQMLDAPFNVTYPVHWCGYANQTLRASIEPVIQEWLREQMTPQGTK